MKKTKETKKELIRNANYYLVLSENSKKKENLVVIAWWTHLYPYRTQKLSIITAKIVRKCDNSKLPVL